MGLLKRLYSGAKKAFGKGKKAYEQGEAAYRRYKVKQTNNYRSKAANLRAKAAAKKAELAVATAEAKLRKQKQSGYSGMMGGGLFSSAPNASMPTGSRGNLYNPVSNPLRMDSMMGRSKKRKKRR